MRSGGYSWPPWPGVWRSLNDAASVFTAIVAGIASRRAPPGHRATAVAAVYPVEFAGSALAELVTPGAYLVSRHESLQALSEGDLFMTVTRLFSEPFTADNTALVLVDHQTGTLAFVADQPAHVLVDTVVGIAKAALALGVPVVLTSASTSLMGPTLPELAEALAGLPNLERTTLSAWDDGRVRAAIQATGRPRLLFGGIGTNVCLTQAATAAANAGYEAYACIDISGTSSELMCQAAIAELTQAGVGVTTARSVILQILRDNAAPQAQDVYAALTPARDKSASR